MSPPLPVDSLAAPPASPLQAAFALNHASARRNVVSVPPRAVARAWYPALPCWRNSNKPYLNATAVLQLRDSEPAAASGKTAPRHNRAPTRPCYQVSPGWIAPWSVRDRYLLSAKRICRHAYGHKPRKTVRCAHRQCEDSRWGWEQNGYGS